jgi:FAD synthase
MNGYGRGSKKLGVPTANLPHFDDEIARNSLKNGVYFGWGYLPSEGEILGCVANIGKSPTFVNQVIY